MKRTTVEEMNLKLRVLARIYTIYKELGVRCFAVKNREIDKRIWNKTIDDLNGDLFLYLALDNYDLGFERFDGINVGIELSINNGEFSNVTMYEVKIGDNHESN